MVNESPTWRIKNSSTATTLPEWNISGGIDKQLGQRHGQTKDRYPLCQFA